MLFLKSWLEDYINLSGFKTSELAEIITRKSSEVEEVVEITERFECKVLVGKIQSLRKHPEADKLNIFDVNLGEKGIVQIVSAAPNARDGLMVPVALDGAKLSGITIVAKKLRGYESQGMCCGKSELLLETEYSSGLWELNDLLEDETFLGWSICEALPEFFGLEEIMDIKVLPDKIGVIGNHLGMALEIALILEQPELLTPLAVSLTNPQKVVEQIKEISHKLVGNKGEDKDSLDNSLSIVFKDNCNYANSFNLFKFEIEKHFRLDYILQQRMNLIQKNLVGGLVDLSNYLLSDIGQPNHFFSVPKLQKLTGFSETESNNDRLNWSIEKLDTQEDFNGLGQLKQTNLPSNLVVLKQNSTTLHIPGISGGESTKVDEEDTSFLVEIASFKPDQIGRNSFALNYRSDGSKIWSGGVNPARILVGIIRLFTLLEGKSINSELVLSWLSEMGKIDNLNILSEKITSFENNKLDVKLDYIIERLDERGVDYWKETVVTKLSKIGDYYLDNLQFNIFYNRIRTQEDILAELVRLIGFENLQPSYIQFKTTPTENSDFNKKQNWKKTLVNFGFYETITRPFLAENELLLNLNNNNNKNDSANSGEDKKEKSDTDSNDKLKGDYQAFEILNPYSSLQPYFRDSLLPSLLQSTSKNIKHGHKEINMFEASQVYFLQEGKKQEVYEIWGICVGEEISRITSLVHYINKSLQTELSFQKISNDGGSTNSSNNKFNKIGHGYEYTLSKNLGSLEGSSNNSSNQILHQISVFEVNKQTKKFFDIPLTKTVWAFRIGFENQISALSSYPKYTEESDYPGINRSYSLLLPAKLKWAEISQIISQNIPQDSVISLIPTERINETETEFVALNFQVNLQSYTRTLEGQEIDVWQKNWQEEMFTKHPEVKLR